MDFRRIDRLPPYVFNVVNDLKAAARRSGEDIVDLGMGNPDLATPSRIVDKLTEAAENPRNQFYVTDTGRRAIEAQFEGQAIRRPRRSRCGAGPKMKFASFALRTSRTTVQRQ